MEKILVLWTPWAGKSSFANALAEKLWYPVYHLDKYLQQPNRQRVPLEKELEFIESIITEPKRIIEWNYQVSFEIRAQAADTIIYLWLSRYKCLRNAFTRYIRSTYFWLPRPDIGPNKDNRLYWKFYKRVRQYDRLGKPFYFDICERLNKPIVVLKTYKQYQAFIDSIEQK